ncbi:GDSL-type esterase/lipase family protein [Spelaeicoccus albus]|uniref:Lysophospholipase L1-like esterase n=1 Tax=Spelaeicoccus albus TaxID=1280376 RepID=A0A7Z0D3E8_9MICO|nr:GDSL-type esterase/lipase family protein [Spelaeicoccus albus]NYI68125.1 lysophospholipase L1-like esterase [Spelaeicoccus albus]
MRQTTDTRIVVIGDELAAGAGDARALGWVGRVAAKTAPLGPHVQFFGLGIPGEDSVGMAGRWQSEALRRFSKTSDNRLVLAPGRGDITSGLSLARSRLNLANILDEALSAEVSTFVVGPPPVLDADTNRRVGELASGFADVASRRSVAYVDTFTPLVAHEQWRSDLAGTDGHCPGQAGYGLMAWLVLHRGWYSWLSLPDPAA